MDQLALAHLFQAQSSGTDTGMLLFNAKTQRRRDAKKNFSLRLCVSASLRFILLVPFISFSAESLDDRTRIAVEAVLKLQGVNLEQNAKLKDTVSKLLARTEGTSEFVRLVQHFKLTGQEEGLLKAAVQNPKSDFGIEAMRMVIANKERILKVVNGGDVEAARNCVEAVGNSRAKEAPTLLAGIVTDEARDISVRRQAVKSLSQTQDGAKALLQLNVPDNLKFTAASELALAPWPEVQAKAKEIFPLPAAHNAEPLPPVAELIKRKGDAKNGEKVFNSPTAGCAACHQVSGQGIDFGPNLTEIGSKLAKEALYESILDPSAGISFGYEAWSVELKSGDELYGLIVSDTPEQVAVKTVGGVVTKCRPGEIARRDKSKLSIMPAGLQQNMSIQDLVDLVEYLETLKSKKANPEAERSR